MNNAKKLKLDHWYIDIATGEVEAAAERALISQSTTRLEPQGIRFLQVLAQQPHQLVSKENLLKEIWQNTVVTDDALSRCVSRVRKALQDDAKHPTLVETLPKRGYRLIASDIQWLDDVDATGAIASTSNQSMLSTNTSTNTSVNKGYKVTRYGGVLVLIMVILLGIIWLIYQSNSTRQSSAIADSSEDLVARGDDYYAQIRRLDNEMAIELYQQALAIRPDSGAARAGMANALVQQVIRWPNNASEEELSFNGIHQAILDGRTGTEEARTRLQRALEYAQKAVQLAPNDPRTHKALGLVLSAQSQFPRALDSYKKAVELNPNAWDALINIGGILENAGDLQQAVTYFELTFEAMSRVSEEQSVRVRPWRADMGAVVGETYLALQNISDAEVWFRHVLSFAPFNFRATKGLVSVLNRNGEYAEVKRLCEAYLQRAGDDPCQDLSL